MTRIQQQKSHSPWQQNAARLDSRLHHVMRDFQYGTPTAEGGNERIPETGHPWVQVLRYRFGKIDGWLALDGFYYVNAAFHRPKPDEAIATITQGHGVFATTDSLRKVTFPPVFLTHHITREVSIERLLADLEYMFGLSLVLRWSHDEDKGFIEREIMPQCRVQAQIHAAAEAKDRLIVHRIGNEQNMRHIAKHGAKTNERNTDMLGRFHGDERQEIEEEITRSVQEWLAKSIDAGLKWGQNVDNSTEDIHEEVLPRRSF